MKNVKFFISIVVLFTTQISNAQTFNWGALNKEQKQFVNVNINSEYALTYGVGYSYKLKSKLPVILNAEYSFPSGANIIDDFKTRIGGQIDWAQVGNVHFVTKIHGIFRRYENDYARLVNFGSDLSGIIGYYKPKWFVAAEIGFDKAIITNFKHSDLFRSYYPDVKDGWYEPSAGGNFYYGIQAGLSGKKFDVYLKAGKLTEQDFKASPMLPVFGQAGVNFKFR